jgi:hypothetical protein
MLQHTSTGMPTISGHELHSILLVTKSCILLFFGWAGVQTLNAQIPSSCNVVPVLQHYYDRDVKHLALKRIFDQNAPAMDSINIPQNYQDTVWQAMAGIFNLSDFPPRDTVFDIYCIHQYSSSYIFDSIYVQITPSCPWLHNWQNFIIETGVPALDSLLSRYGFIVTGFWTYFDVAILTTSQHINVRPLCDSIATFSGVVYAEPISMAGFGDQINYTTTGTNRFLNFVIGYGDCPSGCTGFRTYKFQVDTDCSVQYLGSFLIPAPDYTFPPPVNCYITTGIENKKINTVFHIFPNPAENVLNIRSDNPSVENFFIFNSLGQLINSGQILKEATISIDNFSPGLYLILFTDIKNQQRVIVKFTKK